MRYTQTLFPLLVLSLAIGCATEEYDSRFTDLHPDLSQPSLDDPLDVSQRTYGVEDENEPPQPSGLAEPAGEIHFDDVDLEVRVGDEVIISFWADVWDVDPSDTYLTLTGAPAEAIIDVDLGTFFWIPTGHDVGEHKLGIDLWYDEGEAGQRILDARSILIEVVPRSSLIEVGI